MGWANDGLNNWAQVYVHLSLRWALMQLFWEYITKTHLFKYTENFTTKNENFQI